MSSSIGSPAASRYAADRRGGGGGQSGFTLLEVLIAFTILAVALGALFQTFSTGLRGLRASEARTIALLHAQSKLEELGITTPLREGEEAGQFDDGLRWTSRVSPHAAARGGENARLSMMAYDVELEVTWREGRTERVLLVRTVRTGAAP